MPAVLVFVASLMSAQVNESSAQGYITRGRLMFEDDNFIGCIDQLTHAKNLDLSEKEAEEVDFLLALSLLRNGDEVAQDAFKAFIARFPSSEHRGDALMAIGDCEFGKKRYGEALTAYRRVDSRALNDARREDLIYRRAYCCLRLGEYKDAVWDFVALEGVERYASASKFYQGYIAYYAHDYDKAMSLFEGVDNSCQPGNMADYYLAQIYFVKEDFPKALDLSKQLLARKDIADEHFVAEIHRIAGESLYASGHENESMAYLEKYAAMAQDPMPSALYILGVNQYQKGDYKQAIKYLTPASSEDNAMGQSALLYIGHCYGKIGNSNAAMLAFEKSSRMEFNRSVQETAFYNYAVARMDGGRVPFGNSVDVLDNFLQRFPDSRYAPTIQKYLVSGYMNENNYDAALRSIENIKNPSEEILSTKQYVLYALGERALSSGQLERARICLEKAKSLGDYNAEVVAECNFLLGDCLYRQAKYADASSRYSDYLKVPKSRTSNRVLAYYNLGYSRFAEKRYDDAMVNFRKVADASNGLSKNVVADAYNRIGDCFYYKSNFQEAVKYYDIAYKTSQSAGDYSLFQKAVMNGYDKDYRSKIKNLTLVEDKFPSSGLLPAVLLEKAETYVAVGDNDSAIKTYKQLVERYPATVQARNGLLQLAITYMSNDMKKFAVETYKKVIVSYPTSEEARVAADDLKRIYADDGNLEDYTGFISSIPDAPEMDMSEVDALTFQAAEKHYLTKNGTTKLEAYLSSFPDGAYRAQTLHYLGVDAYDKGEESLAYDYVSRIAENHADATVVEEALLIKAEIEHNQGKGELALASYRELEKRASSPRNLKMALLGIMRVSQVLGYDNEVMAVVERLKEIIPDESAEMPEVIFAGALAAHRSQKYSEAIDAWSQLSKDVNNMYGAQAAVYLAEHYCTIGDLKNARSVIELLINSNTPYQYWLARGFIVISDINRREGNAFEADEYLRTLKDNYPGAEADIFIMIEQRLNKK